MISIPSLMLLAGVLTGPVGDARAVRSADDGLRCGNRLVTLGETKAEVVTKCGTPTFQEQRTEVRQYGRTLVTVTVDVWTYNLGPYTFMRTLTFENGRLLGIEAGSYGK